MLAASHGHAVFSVDAYADPNGPQGWRGYSVRLCHGSSRAQGVMADIFERMNAVGAALGSFDQEIGGGMVSPCYNKAHGHPLGAGRGAEVVVGVGWGGGAYRPGALFFWFPPRLPTRRPATLSQALAPGCGRGFETPWFRSGGRRWIRAKSLECSWSRSAS